MCKSETWLALQLRMLRALWMTNYTTFNPSFADSSFTSSARMSRLDAEQQLLCQLVAIPSLALTILGKGLEHCRTLLHLRRSGHTFTETRALAATRHGTFL